MSKSAKSIFVFGMYLVGMGLGLIAMPNLVLGTLGFPNATEVWVRVVGVLALVLAVYYIQAARADLRLFFRWTVLTRMMVFLFFAGFALTGLVSPMLILLGAVDLAASLWTAWALRLDSAESETAVPSVAVGKH
ncbi:MAG: hypothetical protein H6656_05950 [Ardenticatenaceae bacterium]|nr:hypothetical protein [Ardenticatenaceae bacterium]